MVQDAAVWTGEGQVSQCLSVEGRAAVSHCQSQDPHILVSFVANVSDNRTLRVEKRLANACLGSELAQFNIVFRPILNGWIFFCVNSIEERPASEDCQDSLPHECAAWKK